QGFDPDAPLIPGISAAGWRIGTGLGECGPLLHGAIEVEYQPGFHLVNALNANDGVLVVRNYFPLGSGHTAIFVGADVGEFHFNGRDELFEVAVGKGYRGRAFGRIGVGSRLEEVRSLFPVFYDSGDEMYYPDSEVAPDAPPGIAFLATETAEPSGTPILAISIHDWHVMRRSVVK
ncbi:MAG TPA: hypothetical protein VF796_29190, partial [Humisphaera sp.]